MKFTESLGDLDFLGLFLLVIGVATIILYKIGRGSIDLSTLLSEADGKASLSRFQFLLFTFVIAGVWLYLSVESGSLVDVPEHVLWLLGISGGSYTLSKGIQTWGASGPPPPAAQPQAPPSAPPPPPAAGLGAAPADGASG